MLTLSFSVLCDCVCIRDISVSIWSPNSPCPAGFTEKVRACWLVGSTTLKGEVEKIAEVEQMSTVVATIACNLISGCTGDKI